MTDSEKAGEWKKRKKKKEKQAASMGQPGAVGSALADTIGRVISGLTITPSLVGGKSAFKNPRKNRKSHEESLELLSKARPNALSDTKLRLGAPNLFDDMLWKEEGEGESLPWYKQLGGRIAHNKRTGPLGKVLGYPRAPLKWLLTSLTRSPHYDPATDVAHNMWDNKAVTEHELGHAMDFNSLTNDGKVPETMLGRAGSGTARDLYEAAYSIPMANLYHENEANRESEEALRDVLPKEEFLERTKARGKVLPSGYGSYIGGGIGNLLAPGAGGLAGGIAGAAVGKNWETDQKEKGKGWEEHHESKSKSEKQPRDGDGDGKVNDGTDEEKAASYIQQLAKAAAWYDYLPSLKNIGSGWGYGRQVSRGRTIDAKAEKVPGTPQHNKLTGADDPNSMLNRMYKGFQQRKGMGITR
tara:strand:- start:251 stop:1489 length:1239 start_codon:yes stop_codon:yes gene_type:complete